MADQVKIRRGTAAAVAAFTGAQGELTATTDTNRLEVHDGVTAGGHPHALQSELVVNCSDTGTTNTMVVASTIGPAGLVDGLVLAITMVAANTGAATINYNAAGPKTLFSGTGVALLPGVLQAGAKVLVIYRATIGAFVLLAAHGGAPQFASALPINQGGTGASTAAAAVVNLGLSEALVFAGTWNANTNTPAFASGAGTPGALYKVSVAGNTALDGISTWAVGDEAVFNGTSSTWNKIDGQASEVLSVAGRTGAVVLTSADLADFAAAAAADAPVQSVAGRIGAVVLSATDIANGAALNVAQTYSKTQSAGVQALAYAATVTIDLTQNNDAALTLTGAVIFANPSTMPVGASGMIKIIQDATGGRIASWGSYWKFGAAGTPTLSTAANAIDVLSYHVIDAGRIVAALITGVQ